MQSILIYLNFMFPTFYTVPDAPNDVKCSENDENVEISWTEVNSLCTLSGYEISWTEHVLWSDASRDNVTSVTGTSYTSEHTVPYSNYTAQVRAVVNNNLHSDNSLRCYLQTEQKGKQLEQVS